MLSVIIPTYNRCSLLKTTLSSILSQTLPLNRFEVIVVDNGSTDNTKASVLGLAVTNGNIRYVYEAEPGLHSGRHRGMKEAKGEILVFADDDIRAFPSWLETIEKVFQDKRIGIVGGKNLPEYEQSPPPWIEKLWVKVADGQYMTYFSLLDLGDEPKLIHPHYVFGCNFSIRREIVLATKGFHPDGMPNDKLKYRGDGETYVATKTKELGWLTFYHPGASVMHWVPASRMNLEYIRTRAFAEGITKSYCDVRYDQKGKKLIRGIMEKFWLKFSLKFRTSTETELRMAFEQGYAFHKSEVAMDPELLSWVKKENYLDR